MPIRLMRLTPRRANLRILFSLFSDNLCVPTMDEAQAWLGKRPSFDFRMAVRESLRFLCRARERDEVDHNEHREECCGHP